MAVLVTGGAGYIGSHTAVALHEAGREVDSSTVMVSSNCRPRGAASTVSPTVLSAMTEFTYRGSSPFIADRAAIPLAA